MSRFNATEQRVHHSRAMLNAAVANIARAMRVARSSTKPALACSSYYWTTPLPKDGISSLAGRMQTGVYAYDWDAFFRGFAHSAIHVASSRALHGRHSGSRIVD